MNYISSLFTPPPHHCHAADLSIKGNGLAFHITVQGRAAGMYGASLRLSGQGIHKKEVRALCPAGVVAVGYGFAFHMDKLPGGVQLWLQQWLSKEHERPATTSKLIAYHLELWFSDNR